MKKSFKPKSMLYPMPVLVIATYDENKKPNAMVAAWGGIHDTNQVAICLSSDHKTTKNIRLNKEFTISFADAKHVSETDYFGIESGNKEENKIDKAALHTIESEVINAPIIEEYPVTIECKVNTLTENADTTFIIADIVNIVMDSSVLDENDKLDYSKAEFISYEPAKHLYIKMGDVVGHAFKDGKKIQ